MRVINTPRIFCSSCRGLVIILMDITHYYEIIRDIDEGAFGAVLLARSKETGKDVAIKRMKKKMRSRTECAELREVP